MPRLGETVAALARRRRGLAEHAAAPGQGPGGRLQDVTDFGSNPGALRMKVHAPQSLGDGAALVVVLHGCTQTAEGYAAGAGWLDLADRMGFVVLCPEQTRANNPNLCFNWFQPGDTARGEGEAASIRAMIAHATKTYDIDPSRVFVTGLSAGAAMANALLAGYPEVFAGGALMAGLPHGAAATMQEAFTAMRHGVSRTPGQWGDAVRGASAHAGPWPRVSIWHGDEDATVSPGVADEVTRQWVNVHGATATLEEERLENGRRRTVWRDAAGEPVVELHRIARMGHGAPLGRSLADGCGKAGPYLLEVGVSSTLEAARTWGLVDGAPRASAPPPAHPPETAPRRPSVPPPREGPGRRKAGLPEGVEAVIVNALRSAGLMK